MVGINKTLPSNIKYLILAFNTIHESSLTFLIKLYNKNKNKGKFQSFVNFTKKINDNDFSGFNFYEKAL